jgi:osmotically-inducible protein OsmY
MKTDLEIQKNVQEELKWEPSINASEIGVAVSNGIVTLTGYVDTFSKRKIAKNAAQRVVGVKAVAEDIVVKLLSSSKKTDTDIAQAVVNALKWHASVQENRIKVTVESGWVTLEGTVNWAFEKEATKLAIENLMGVIGVSNLITIEPKVSTTDVKAKIRSAFQRNSSIDANNIIVETIGSSVILTGIVRSFAEKQDAEDAAYKAIGITDVDNQLEVKIPVLAF